VVRHAQRHRGLNRRLDDAPHDRLLHADLCRFVSPAIEVPLALCVSDHQPLSEPAQAVKAIVLELVDDLELEAGQRGAGGP
jgi:hypothetical protein